jgi:polyisoprenyl-phosphate glycosyltransferase
MEEKKVHQQSSLLTVVTPAFNEAENLPVLFGQLIESFQDADFDWEWIIVDDHSSDKTYTVASAFAEKDERVRAFRFSRNYGSHMALRCGFEHARGDCVVGMAADMQDPPDLIPQLLARWKAGVHVVWAARASRPGEKRTTLLFSRWYYRIMRDVVGLKEMPVDGADFFLVDRKVVDAINQFREKNVSLFALIAWMGFNQETVTYDKHARQHGHSGWSLEKKLKMAVDSLTSFSYKPIRLMTYTGFAIAFLSFVYLVVVLINYLTGVAPQGWTSQMAAIVLMGGLQMMMIGILGEYIWRSLDESRQRPSYIIEAQTGHDIPDKP